MSGLSDKGDVFEPQALRMIVNLLCALSLVIGLSVVRIPAFRPDVLTLVVVFLALEHELVFGLIIAVCAGYLSDLYSGLGPGLDAATNVGVYLVLRVFVTRIAGSRPLTVTVLALMSTVLALLIRQALEALLGPNQASLRGLVPALPSIILVPIFTAYPLYRVLRWVDGQFRPKVKTALGGRSSRGVAL